MKCYKTLLLLVVGILLALPNPSQAQNASTQGKEFWVSFMGNGFKDRYNAFGQYEFTWLRTQLIVSAKRDCNCTIKNPNTGYSQSFTVEANNTYLFDNIPWEEAYMELDEYGQALNKGLIISADDTVSVYCSNIAEMSFDASYVLPSAALGNDYIIQTYDQSTSNTPYANYYTSAFLIVATEEGETTVDITPNVNTLEGHAAHEAYSITLHFGESYQVRSHNSFGSRDLSGTRVTARDCKKIAVFNGNNLTMVPNDGNDSDCIFEQAMPLTAWGKKFVVTASLGRNLNDIVKITSAYDNNEIHLNGTVLTTLNTGESTSFELRQSDKSCYIEASRGCAVYLYNHSKDNDSWTTTGLGAPSMVCIAPIEQRIHDITFSTFNYESEHDTDIRDHYVNIIVGANDIENVFYDGELLPSTEFAAVNSAPQYCFLRKKIEHGVHRLTCSNGVNAHVYGFGYARGYAYMVGSNAIDLSTSVTINEATIFPEESYPYCTEESMDFQVDVNIEDYSLQWDFGDGTTSTDNPATHIYHNSLIYPVTLTISAGNGCWSSTTQASTFFIDLTQQYIIEEEETCVGDYYSSYGFDNVPISNDTILTRLVDNAIHPECKDSLLVYLTAHPSYHIPFNESRCWQGEPSIYDGHGFSFEYDGIGEYDRQLELTTVNGCDSIVTLHLTINNMLQTELSEQACMEYTWNDSTYYASGDYSIHYTSLQGCDSIVTLHLTINHIQYTEWSQHAYNSFTWNDSVYDISGDYIQEFTSQQGCDSIVTLHLEIEHELVMTEWTATACDNFEWNGVTYDTTGDYTQHFVSQHEGDSIVTLHLTVNNAVETEWADLGCYSYEWNGIVYDTTGDYSQVFSSQYGCDSTVMLHLTIGTNVEGATDFVTGCDTYTWYEEEYTESGIYPKVFPSVFGCDSTIYLNLALEYTPTPTEIMPADADNTTPHWVITASEFQINSYNFTIQDDNPNWHWDSVLWALDRPEAHWILEPDTTTQPPGMICKLMVLNSLTDTIWLQATVYNECHPQGVERRYWLLCSFYSLDEQDAKAQFEVVPNPNNGDMDLVFEHLYGKNDIKVYDMKGAMIDHFETYNGTQLSSFHYTMKPVNNGMYFFVVSGANGILTKKAIIVH